MVLYAQHNDRAKRDRILSTKRQEVTSNVAITKKNEKQYLRLQLSIPGTQRVFSDKVTPNIDDFTDEREVQCGVQDVNNTFEMIPNKW